MRILEGDAGRIDGLPDGSVQLVVTSPPYPMVPMWDALFERAGATGYDGMHAVLDRAWSECYRVLIPGGIAAINIGDALRSGADGFRLWPNHSAVLSSCAALGFRPLPYILWKKPTNRPNAFLGSGFLPPNAYVTLDCEYILLFRKDGLRRFPPHDRARRDSRFSRADRDRWFSQIWSDIRGTRQGPAGARTAAFPPELPGRLVRMFSVIGDTVLDPFAGTGTTLWEARRLGRNSIGVEIDPDLAERLRRRARETTGPVGSVGGGRAGGRSPPRRRS